MIVSIHIPKTAGKSFRFRLKELFGARMLCDYGDWVGPETPEVYAQRAEQAARMQARRDEILRDYDIIYGQFIADKYAEQFSPTAFTAFFRDPYQRAVSHYEFLRRHPEIEHPLVRRFHQEKPTLPELLEAFPNYQSIFLGQVPLDDFAMVGITEQYERSVALFEAVFNHKLPHQTRRENVNPHRQRDRYEIDPAVRKAIDTYNTADVELYQRACRRFADLAARYDI